MVAKRSKHALTVGLSLDGAKYMLCMLTSSKRKGYQSLARLESSWHAWLAASRAAGV